MPDYNAELFNPPAPIAFVTLQNSENTVEISSVPMLLDTGADATPLPRIYIEKLKADFSDGRFFELEGFNNSPYAEN